MENTGSPLRIGNSYSDIYHIPMRHIREFSHLAQFFLQHFIFLELAIPTIIMSVEKEENIANLIGHVSWNYTIRHKPWLFIQQQNLNAMYFHPTKWAYIDKDSHNHTAFFCKMVHYIYKKYVELL